MTVSYDKKKKAVFLVISWVSTYLQHLILRTCIRTCIFWHIYHNIFNTNTAISTITMCLFELTLNPLEAPWLSSTPKQCFWALNMDIFKNSFWAVEVSNVRVWRRKTEFCQLGSMLLEKQVGRADWLILITWHAVRLLHACHFTCIYIESNGESMNIVRSDWYFCAVLWLVDAY